MHCHWAPREPVAVACEFTAFVPPRVKPPCLGPGSSAIIGISYHHPLAARVLVDISRGPCGVQATAKRCDLMVVVVPTAVPATEDRELLTRYDCSPCAAPTVGDRRLGPQRCHLFSLSCRPMSLCETFTLGAEALAKKNPSPSEGWGGNSFVVRTVVIRSSPAPPYRPKCGRLRNRFEECRL